MFSTSFFLMMWSLWKLCLVSCVGNGLKVCKSSPVIIIIPNKSDMPTRESKKVHRKDATSA